jgi:hypothetical protein
VRPAREGAPYLHTVSKQSKHLDSVDKAACGIYLHISQHAETAFPGWARWTEAGAVEAYADGRLHLRNDEWPEAIERYTQAAAADRLNVLARLVLTNLYEVLITQPDDADRALAQSRVLRSYLDVACQWPSLVEPRYRASIVAATLASTCNVLLPEHQGQVRATLQLPGDPPDLTVAMRELASRESKAAVQLLKGWYVLVREGRLRTLFEPRGSDRRRLLHTVRISEHCLRLRSFTAISPFRRAEVRMRSLLVHVGVTFLGQGEMSWQARYNAACFDSLLLRYLERYAASPMNPVWQSARKRRVRARGLRALDRAIKDAGRELSPDWIWRDPDLDSLKSAARWKEIVGAPPDPETTAPALMPPEHATPYRALPSAPWPYLRLRAVFWGAVAIAGVVLFWFTESRWWWVAVGIGVWRARRALWELGVTAQVWRPIRAVADSVWRWVRQLGRRFDYGA